MKLLIFLFSCVVFYGQQLREGSVYVEPDVYQECNNIDPSKIDYCLGLVAKKLDDLSYRKPKPKKQIKLFKKLKTDLENKKKVLGQRKQKEDERRKRIEREKRRDADAVALANPSRSCPSLRVDSAFTPKRGGLRTGRVTKSYVDFSNKSNSLVNLRFLGKNIVSGLCPGTVITIGLNNSYSGYPYEYKIIAVGENGKELDFFITSGAYIDDRIRTPTYQIIF